MRENIGKEIKETATRIRRGLILLTSIIGTINILSAVVALLITEDWSTGELIENPLISQVLMPCIVGVLWIVAGKFVAEYIDVMIYGFGIMVDRLENLKPEFFSDTSIKKPVGQSPAKPQYKPAKPGSTPPTWTCDCGYKNSMNAPECANCFTKRP